MTDVHGRVAVGVASPGDAGEQKRLPKHLVDEPPRASPRPLASDLSGCKRASANRPQALLITPFAPNAEGTGTQQRAARTLKALSQLFDVHLVIMPLFAEPSTVNGASAHAFRTLVLDPEDSTGTHWRMLSCLPEGPARIQAELDYPWPRLSRACTARALNRIIDWLAGTPLTAIHVQRLYMAPLVETLLRSSNTERPFFVLDIDDDEVLSNGRLADLYRARGQVAYERALQAEATKYEACADQYYSLFDRVTVCSELDRRRLTSRHPGVSFTVLPNCVEMCLSPEPGRQENVLSTLFVGTLNYPPNEDAAQVLCDNLRPVLQRAWAGKLQMTIAGAAPSDFVRAVTGVASVHLLADVADLSSVYSAADVAVIPLRAGGGTRVKILEAFVYGVPVVSTSLGAEGLEVEHGTHLLIADTPEQFAASCVLLKRDIALRSSLVDAASALLYSRYSSEVFSQSLSALYSDTL